MLGSIKIPTCPGLSWPLVCRLCGLLYIFFNEMAVVYFIMFSLTLAVGSSRWRCLLGYGGMAFMLPHYRSTPFCFIVGYSPLRGGVDSVLPLFSSLFLQRLVVHCLYLVFGILFNYIVCFFFMFFPGQLVFCLY